VSFANFHAAAGRCRARAGCSSGIAGLPCDLISPILRLYGILFYEPARATTVSFTGPDGIRHSVNVQGETLYEAIFLAIRAFREHECAPGVGSQLEVEARSPSVTHTVSMAKVQDWLRSSAKIPSDKIMNERLKGLLPS